MARFVFLTSKFVPFADASGVCVYNISKELSERGHDICVISEGEKNGYRELEGMRIYELRQTCYHYWKNKASNTKQKKDYYISIAVNSFRRFINLFMVFRFPDVSALRTKKEYRLLKKINKKKKIDCIIGCFRPYEGIAVINKFKKKNNDVFAVACYMDLIRANNPFGRSMYGFFDWLCYRSEKKVFSTVDQVLIPKSGKDIYSQKRFDFSKEKIQYFDFPVFTKDMIINESESNKSCGINVTCIGTVNGINRSASYFLKIMSDLRNDGIDLYVNIIGEFSETEIYNKYKDESYVNFCGHVEFANISAYISNADFLINLSNIITYDMIPSKIFQYFASCKPIINFVTNKEDRSLPYFEKYLAVCNIYEYENNFKKDLIKVKDYICNSNMVKFDYDDVLDIYKESTPSFFVKKNLKIFENSNGENDEK